MDCCFFFIYLCKLSPVSRHEDGTVRFWDASSTSMSLLYKLSTASLFNVEIHGDHNSGEVEEEWPPFRKVHRGMVMVPWRIRTTAPCMAHTITFTVSNFNWVFIIFHILLLVASFKTNTLLLLVCLNAERKRTFFLS